MQSPPGNSFLNPVERIKSIVNLGLKGVSFKRRGVESFGIQPNFHNYKNFGTSVIISHLQKYPYENLQFHYFVVNTLVGCTGGLEFV